MTMRRAVAPALLAMLAAAAPAAAQPSGAASCSGCHAPAGAGPVPSLEGRPAAEIAAAMAAFRSGERPATVMDRIAKGFTDEETRAIAEWLANERDHAGP
ncbi:c-type cytochrome [Inquilinus limosus]|uniref:c-type cytochrome n=1 Tax=Inquilinus limosus TaxID=171674 RepID=UPI003F5CCE4F